MAESQFQGKVESKDPRSEDPESKKSPKGFVYRYRKMKDSLGLRVLFLCVTLIMTPVFLYDAVTLYRLYRTKLNELGLELGLIGRSYENGVDFFIESQTHNLQTWNLFSVFEELLGEQKPCPFYCPFFKDIAAKQHLSSLYFIKKDDSGKFVYYVSSRDNRVGKEIYFSGDLKLVEEKGQAAFLETDPENGEKELFVGIAIYEKDKIGPQAYLVSGVPAMRLLERSVALDYLPYTFELALIEKNKLFMSTNPEFELEEIQMASLEDLEKEKKARFPIFETKGYLPRFFFQQLPRFGINIPIEKTDFSVVIEVPSSQIFSVNARDEYYRFSLFFLGCLLLGSGVTIWFTVRMAQPMMRLLDLMRQVGKGNLKNRFYQDKFGFEVNVLGESFNRMIQSLKEYIQTANQERVEKETLAKELQIGQDIQKSILPREMPVFPGLDLAAGFLPAKQVGGDFYDLFLQGDKKLLFTIADTSGKGISACLYSLCVRSMLRSYDALYGKLSEVVRLSNNLFCLDTADSGVFVTAWIGLYDAETRKLQYSNCGHLPAMLCRKNGEIIELSTPGMALGVETFSEVATASIEIFPGDYLLLYTDGIVEAHDRKNVLFGKQRLLDFIDKSKGLPSQELVNRLIKEVQDYSQGVPQHDDVTLLVIRIV